MAVSNDTNNTLAEESVANADILGEPYVAEVAHLALVNDLETLRIFNNCMKQVIGILRSDKVL
jgi:hypothetical protein